MADKTYSSELERALARADAPDLKRQTRAYYEYYLRDFETGEDENTADIDAVNDSEADPDRALAYVVLAASTYDDPQYLAFIGAGLLENLLDDPSEEFLERIVAEARKAARFRWLLSVPFKVAISERAWEAIKPFRITGEHEEPTGETLPSRPRA